MAAEPKPSNGHEAFDQNGAREAANPAPEAEWTPSRHELLIIITLAVVNLLVALDASIIVTSLSAIITDLGGDTTQGFWIGTSYLLVNAVTMPIMASLSDIFGRPVCLEVSLVAFTIGTILCCAAPGIALMLVGRCIQGIGGGGIHVLGGVILTDIVPLRHRPKWFGIVLAAWALGTCIGPIIGGAITENTTWRWVFYLMFPICAYGIIVVPFLLTLKPKRESLGQKLRRVDWVGSILFMGSSTSFLIALCWGGTQKPWDSAATIVPLVVGVVGLGVTMVWESKFAREPIISPSLFNSTSSTVTYILGAAQGFLMWGSFYYIPFYFQAVQQTSPLTAGVNILPAMLVLVPGSVVTGRLVTRHDNYRVAMRAGWALTTAWGALAVSWRFAALPVAPALWVATLLVLGLGHGAVLNAQTWATQALCAAAAEGRAAAAYLFARQLGAAVGVGIGGAVFQNVMARRLRSDGLPEAIAHDAEAWAARLSRLEDPGLRERLRVAFVHGFAGVFQLYLAVAAVAFLLALCAVRHVTLNKALHSDHTLDTGRASSLLVGRGAAAAPSAGSQKPPVGSPPPPKQPQSRSSSESSRVSSAEAEARPDHQCRLAGQGPYVTSAYDEGWQHPALHDQRYAPHAPRAAVVCGESGTPF